MEGESTTLIWIKITKKCDICHYWYFLGTRCLKWVSWCIDDVYEAAWYCYFKHSRCWLLLYYWPDSQKWRNKINVKYWFEWKKWYIIRQKKLFLQIKIDKEIITFGDIEIEKHKFYHHKTPIFLKDINIDIVLVSKKISSGTKNYKCFIGY